MKKNNKRSLCVYIFGCFYITCILVIVLSPYSYSSIIDKAFEPISFSHPFGTDNIGRDMMVRVCLASIISIHIAFFSVICGLAIGLPYGCIAGYHRGWLQAIMTSVLDILESIPEFLCAMMLMTFFNGILDDSIGGILGILATLILVSWTSMARIIKNEVSLLVKENYILYASLKRASYFHIFRWHLVPNLWGTIVSTLMQKIPSAIFLEAFLSFVGIGIRPPFPSLGKLINDGITYFRKSPTLLLVPSIFLFLIVLFFNLFSNFIQKKDIL